MSTSLHALAGESLALTLNRAEAAATDARFALPADGWFQIARPGSMRKTLDLPDGKSVEITQQVDAADFDQIVARFRAQAAAPNFAGLLVDFDHFSCDDDKSTRAGAWIESVERRGDDLWAQLRLSSTGRSALEGGDFRLFSPVLGFTPKSYQPGEVAHPQALLGGAFTNQPTFRGMVPLSNRQDSATTTTQVTTTMDYKAKLLALLGLPDTATDADVEAALAPATENMQNGKKFPATQCRLAKLEAAQIETDLDAHGLKGTARESWKAALTKNRDESLVLLTALGTDGSGYARTHNRDTAKTPAGEKAEKPIDARRNEAVDAYRTQNRCTFQQAWEAVRAATPALFADEAKS